MAHPNPGDPGRPSEPVRVPPHVRARVAPRPEPPFDRLFDAVTQDLVRGGPLARERFATRWDDTGALRRLAAAKRAPLAPDLARGLDGYHRRLRASARSLDSLGRLAAGAAVCAVTGQQPGPLGGPLYTLHKIAGAVGQAAAVAERTGVPCVPVFWMHGEDSDFEEIRTATFAGPEAGAYHSPEGVAAALARFAAAHPAIAKVHRIGKSAGGREGDGGGGHPRTGDQR